MSKASGEQPLRGLSPEAFDIVLDLGPAAHVPGTEEDVLRQIVVGCEEAALWASPPCSRLAGQDDTSPIGLISELGAIRRRSYSKRSY